MLWIGILLIFHRSRRFILPDYIQGGLTGFLDLWLPWLNPADRSHRQAAFRKIILILMGKRTQVKGNFGKRNFTAE